MYKVKKEAEESFSIIGTSAEALGAVLDKHGLSWVVMPEPWTGDLSSGTDLFTRGTFFVLLEASPPA